MGSLRTKDLFPTDQFARIGEWVYNAKVGGKQNKFMKRWTQIFKALSNINRVRIIKILSDRDRMSVSEIADELDISPKATSKHLIILHNLDVLASKGKNSRVEYWLNPGLPVDIKKTIRLFT